VGKSSLIVSFISGSVEDIAPTIGISLLVWRKTIFLYIDYLNILKINHENI
jgi:GTPase SAR1 family protein